MTLQYLRGSSLILGPAQGGKSLELGTLHFTFTVTRATINTPQTATIRIYNLADSTAQFVYSLSPSAQQQDGGQVWLKAGYTGITTGAVSGQAVNAQSNPQSNVGLIFQGEIRQVMRGRENATDTYVDIVATDSDQAYNYGTISATLAAGWSQKDVAGQINQAYLPYGIGVGNNIEFNANKNARGKVMYGMTRAYGRYLALNNACDWSIYNGQTTTVAKDGGLPGEAIIVNAATGLIGFPQQTLDGIDLQCLLDPRMVPGSYIQLNNKDILQYQLSQDYSAVQFVPTLENDGFYRIYWLERHGDTRGNDWYNHIICVGATSPPPITGTYVDTLS